ncbi:unnamed protein product [Ambrosiozyma monospora]|uniref:Unnamed protein product n=1 Tax=Ambrosiozyma monospora TaxID=43982 RepID=A0A9W6Z2N3_AMBMO|nr:unnamed protein product [Ambrosiozyma monospora]
MQNVISSPTPATVKKKRQPRISKACECCRHKKIKCSGEPVCTNCQKHGEECVYRSFYRNTKTLKNSRRTSVSNTTGGDDSEYSSPSRSGSECLVSADGGGVDDGEQGSIKHGKDRNTITSTIMPHADTSTTCSVTDCFSLQTNYSFISTFIRLLNFKYTATPLSTQSHNDNYDHISTFVRNLTSLCDQSSFSTPPSSTFSSMVVTDLDFNLNKVSPAAVNELLQSYLESFNIPLPIFTLQELHSLVVRTWKQPTTNKYDTALLYCTFTIGACSTSTKLNSDNSEFFALGRWFFQEALASVPGIFTDSSFDALQLLLLFSVASFCLGDISDSYLYSGYTIRIGIAIGLMNKALASKLSLSQVRVWEIAKSWESFLSFTLNKPSSAEFLSSFYGQNKNNIRSTNMDNINASLNITAFASSSDENEGAAFLKFNHFQIRSVFYSSCAQIHQQMYNTGNDLMQVLNVVQELCNSLDTVYLGRCDDVITKTPTSASSIFGVSSTGIKQIQSRFTTIFANEQLKTHFRNLSEAILAYQSCQLSLHNLTHWIWLRLNYLHLKMMIYEPFMIFYAYLKKQQNQHTTGHKNNRNGHTNPSENVSQELKSRFQTQPILGNQPPSSQQHTKRQSHSFIIHTSDLVSDMLKEKANWCYLFTIELAQFLLEIIETNKLSSSNSNSKHQQQQSQSSHQPDTNNIGSPTSQNSNQTHDQRHKLQPLKIKLPTVLISLLLERCCTILLFYTIGCLNLEEEDLPKHTNNSNNISGKTNSSSSSHGHGFSMGSNLDTDSHSHTIPDREQLSNQIWKVMKQIRLALIDDSDRCSNHDEDGQQKLRDLRNVVVEQLRDSREQSAKQNDIANDSGSTNEVNKRRTYFDKIIEGLVFDVDLDEIEEKRERGNTHGECAIGEKGTKMRLDTGRGLSHDHPLFLIHKQFNGSRNDSNASASAIGSGGGLFGAPALEQFWQLCLDWLTTA